jgi:hypothetical protein
LDVHSLNLKAAYHLCVAQCLIIVYFCSVNAKEEVLRVSHRLLIDLPPTIHTFKPGGTVTVRVGSKVCSVAPQRTATVRFWIQCSFQLPLSSHLQARGHRYGQGLIQSM